MKKLAVILRGISYYNDMNRVVSSSKNIDYRVCLPSLRKHLLTSLSTEFDISIFLVTYNSEKLIELIDDFCPEDIHIYPKSKIFMSQPRRVLGQLLDGVRMTEGKEYDFYLFTRFDLFYTRDITVNDFDLYAANFGWIASQGQSDDNFMLFPSHYIWSLKRALEDDSYYCHNLNRAFPKVNYLDMLTDSSTNVNANVNAKGMPNFYIFQRFLLDITKGSSAK